MERVRTLSCEVPMRWVALLGCAALSLVCASPARAASCHSGRATSSLVGAPAAGVAWRAELFDATPVYGVPRPGTRARGAVAPWQVSWLLVVGASSGPDGHCWVRVRLPTRPNAASGWLRAEQVLLSPSVWRIEISRRARTLTLFRDGQVVRRLRTVIGAPATPTPVGLFSIIGAWRAPPGAFDGSWVLPLTAHSEVLRRFEGGDGTVGIHGRGGASLRDPLGSARSHGCVRLANAAIDWLVRTVGAAQLAGIPVGVH
jgi:hypothetical protein